MSDVPPIVPRKEKRKYTLSAAARAQRRVAALRTGEHAKSASRRTLPACKASTCPGQCFPCPLRAAAHERGVALEVCPVPLVADSARKEAYLRALQSNDRAAIQPLVAGKLAQLDQLAERELGLLADEGFVIEQEIFGAEGELVGARKAENPRTKGVFQALDILGVGAREQLATPRSVSEAKTGNAISTGVSLLERLLTFRKSSGDLAEGEGQ